MPRKPLGDRPLTAAERQARRRAKGREARSAYVEAVDYPAAAAIALRRVAEVSAADAAKALLQIADRLDATHLTLRDSLQAF